MYVAAYIEMFIEITLERSDEMNGSLPRATPDSFYEIYGELTFIVNFKMKKDQFLICLSSKSNLALK
jgi:hypothetical protein